MNNIFELEKKIKIKTIIFFLILFIPTIIFIVFGGIFVSKNLQLLSIVFFVSAFLCIMASITWYCVSISPLTRKLREIIKENIFNKIKTIEEKKKSLLQLMVL